MRRVSCLICILMALWAGPWTGPAAAEEAPYDARLARLSEILGSVHFLRNLCGEQAEPEWRALQDRLVAAEAPEPDRRARMIAAFNRGYRSFASVYSVCTPSAILAIERYTAEGAGLAQEIVARYGY